MLASIHEKVSSLVNRHRDTIGKVVDPALVQGAVDKANPSKNWDYTITFKGAKVWHLQVAPSCGCLHAHVGLNLPLYLFMRFGC